MTTHTNCSHPKTKAARAACRKGLAQPDGTPARSAAERLADKAATASHKIGKPKGHSHDAVKPAEGVGQGPYAKIYMSGFCAAGRHDACRGQYTLTPCTCACHDAQSV